ncbi:hypothetical protein B0H17DRAFT_1144012 [Mycena rosella]|uniref:Uncharacterized protein n=1 Tax=Mycena rosella TaxID=1033263 RepID=A0AAD7G3D5_MYCRO|nr:hypothetical protein B0H17DRAFT_1144012 [Mycena rosella]
MPKDSKRKRTQSANLLKNLSNIGTKTKHVWDELSPEKLTKWLSPRKSTRKVPQWVENIAPSSLGAPAARSFTWKLPKLPEATVEEVEDEDVISTHTFPAPEPAHPFCSPSSSAPPPADNFDDPRDSIDIPEAEDELLVASPSYGDNYPRPLAPHPFLERMNQQATCPGTRCQAPNLGEAKAALDESAEISCSDSWQQIGLSQVELGIYDHCRHAEICRYYWRQSTANIGMPEHQRTVEFVFPQLWRAKKEHQDSNLMKVDAVGMKPVVCLGPNDGADRGKLSLLELK